MERFAGEAWEANMVLRLYEAATNPSGPDADTIVSFMPDRKEGYGDDSRDWSSVHHRPVVLYVHFTSPLSLLSEEPRREGDRGSREHRRRRSRESAISLPIPPVPLPLCMLELLAPRNL